MSGDPTDVAKVVAGLTEGERGFVTMPLMTGQFTALVGWFHDRRYPIASQVAKKRLATLTRYDDDTDLSIPTPLGLAVRRHLIGGDG